MSKKIKPESAIISTPEVKNDAAISASSLLLDNSRRNFFKHSIVGALGATAMLNVMPKRLSSMAYAAGSDAPEITEVKIGFIPLTDCAPIVVAAEMGFDKKYGIKIIPAKQASWAAVRDKTMNGELHASHVLYGLIYGVQFRYWWPAKRHESVDEPRSQWSSHYVIASNGR